MSRYKTRTCKKLEKNLNHLLAKNAVTPVEISLGGIGSSLLKPWSPGVGWNHKGEGSFIYIQESIDKIEKKIFFKNHLSWKVLTCMKACFCVLFKSWSPRAMVNHNGGQSFTKKYV